MNWISGIIGILFICISSGCVQYTLAPTQTLRPPIQEAQQGYSNIEIINVTGDIEFTRGTPAGLILAGRQYAVVEFPWGAQSVCWYQQMLDGKVRSFCQNIIITNKTRSMVIRPPRDENMYYSRGRGSLQLYDFQY